MKLLHIDASILGAGSVTRQLTAAIVERLKGAHPGAGVVYRDVTQTPVSHLSSAYFGAVVNPTQDQTPTLRDELALGNAILDEFLNAAIVVIGTPLYNFTVPSQLKAWVDRILVPGKTFRYGKDGRPEGLVGQKRVFLAVARGGYYGPETPLASSEHAENYMRTALGFIGIDPEIIVAEGIAVGEAQRAAGIATAQKQIETLRL